MMAQQLREIVLYSCCVCALSCGRIGFRLQDAGPALDADGGVCDDSDHDGVCDSADLCPGADDRHDADGDGFPDGCDPCGDGVVDVATGETCDTGDRDHPCPLDCDDQEACTQDAMAGSAASCNVVCTNLLITLPFNNDSCCPDGANNSNDSDCEPRCGNGVLEAGETCDPSSEMPCSADCDDADDCTQDERTGSEEDCTVVCSHAAITSLIAGDMCCPDGANNTTDADCSPLCGNGTIEGGETCDPPGSCPASCDDNDACTADVSSGAPQNCNVVCSSTPITAPFNGDGCCPPGANSTNDSDCQPLCGNGVVEAGEQCEGGGTSCTPSCTFTNRGQCLALLGSLPERGLGADNCSQCACSRCSTSMLDCYMNGDAQRDQFCRPVPECALDKGCVGTCSDDNFGCYGEFCWWGGNYPYSSTGPCKNSISAAVGGSTDPATVQSRSKNSAYSLYWAEAFGSCLQSKCASQCDL
jgi:hypothetical protein